MISAQARILVIATAYHRGALRLLLLLALVVIACASRGDRCTFIHDAECRCSAAVETGDARACELSAWPHAICCAGRSHCYCAQVRCAKDGDSCTCGAGARGGAIASCTGTVCCASDRKRSCACSSQGCSSDERMVPGCEPQTVTPSCLADETAVSRCP
jgi:hypothetical protein